MLRLLQPSLVRNAREASREYGNGAEGCCGTFPHMVVVRDSLLPTGTHTSHRHMHTRVHTHRTYHSHTHPHVFAHTPDTCTHMCVQTCTHTMHTHTDTSTHVSTCRHTCTHVYDTSYTHMQAYRHTRVHTHIDSCFPTAVTTFIFSGETATWGDVLGVHTSGCPGTS